MDNKFNDWTAEHDNYVRQLINRAETENIGFYLTDISEHYGFKVVTVRNHVCRISREMKVSLSNLYSAKMDKMIVVNRGKRPNDYATGDGRKLHGSKEKFMCKCLSDNEEVWIAIVSTDKEMASKQAVASCRGAISVLSVHSQEEYKQIRKKIGIIRSSEGIRGNTFIHHVGKTRKPL